MKRFLSILAVVIVAAAPLTVYAQAPAPSGGIDISYAIDHEGTRVPIEGAEISVYQAALLDGGVLTAAGPYQEVLTEPDSLFSESAGELTETAAELAEIENEPVFSGTTDGDGHLKAEGLDAGLYLITQTGKTRDAEKYEAFAPYLISVADEVVETEPKTKTVTVQKPAVPPKQEVKTVLGTGKASDKIQTGDSGLWLIAAFGLFAAAALAGVIRTMRTDRK